VTFVSKAITPEGGSFNADTISTGEPSLPRSFQYDSVQLVVKELRRTWKSTKTDRGDVYVKRHWFEFETEDGRTATVYFDRGAKRGQPRWFLFTLD
jgi:hypothetical protein